ncbi:S1 family peptidase [Cohnella fermenti]|uniref:Peptidase S1 domain-containing protein n=1 Tax=Cohnella fermenti TaxID=2565925 RepID=A0A4S4BMS5_9BACL|nr:S1 family peptidase [Cohnella fermenti]THF75933.1 hypothetical protein E6C55_20760 [Cohnella fermenti]
MKKSFFRALIIVLSLLSIVSSQVYAETDLSQQQRISISDLDISNSFREIYGFDPADNLSKAVYSEDSPGRYGVYLTDDELKTLSIRDATINYGKKLQEMLNSNYSEFFGGLYYDHLLDNGKLRIALSNKNKSNAESIQKIVDSSSEKKNIEIYYVDHTLNELISIQNDIINYIINNSLEFYTEISIEKNKIIVQASEQDREYIEQIKKNYGEDILETHLSSPSIQPLSRFDYVRPVRGGLAINNTSTGSLCTGAFTGWTIGPTGPVDLLVTAGHCGSLYDYFSQGNASIGAVNYKYFQGTTDALIILNTTGTVAFNSPYNYDNGYWDATESISSEIAGETICKSGVSSDVTCGPLRTPYASGSVDGTYLVGLRSAALYSTGGDSGAPTYLPGSSGNHTLAGVLSGGNIVAGEQRTLYSHIQNVITNLNLSGVYTL